MMYWQRQCMNYSPPEDQVVWEGEPAAAAALLGNAGDYVDPAVEGLGGAHPLGSA